MPRPAGGGLQPQRQYESSRRRLPAVHTNNSPPPLLAVAAGGPAAGPIRTGSGTGERATCTRGARAPAPLQRRGATRSATQADQRHEPHSPGEWAQFSAFAVWLWERGTNSAGAMRASRALLTLRSPSFSAVQRNLSSQLVRSTFPDPAPGTAISALAKEAMSLPNALHPSPPPLAAPSQHPPRTPSPSQQPSGPFLYSSRASRL